MSGTPNTSSSASAPGAIILAAGKGTRMNSDLPKVCHPVGGRAMVCAVVDACLDAGCERVVVVVGYKQELVREALAPYADRVVFALQDEQLGTGHAVMCARGAFDGAPNAGSPKAEVFVLCGDGPLIRTETLAEMLGRHRSTGAGATLATSVLDDPGGYGRVVRGADGRFERIVEQKNATPEQLEIREVNPSYYCFDRGLLFESLDRLERDEVSGEYYITDVPEMIRARGGRVEVIRGVPPGDVLSINTPEQLAAVDRVFRARVNRAGAAGTSVGGAS